MKKIVIYTLIILFTFISNISYAKEKNEEINKINYINIPFWENFNDEILVNHITKLYTNNIDLKIATLKLEESNKLVKLALASEMPQIAFDGYLGRTLASSDEKKGDIVIKDYSQYRYLTPITFNYEVDIWGKNRLKTKSLQKVHEMNQQDERGLYIALTSNFAIDYFNLIKTDKLISTQEELIKIQKLICNYVKKRYENGLATINDTINEEKNLTYLQEEYNNLIEKRNFLISEVSVYLGDKTFNEIERSDIDSIKNPFNIPNSIPSDILDNRPDVKKSQLKILKTGYDVKSSKANLLPSFSITGALGYNAYSLKHLMGSNTGLANIGVVPFLSIFDGGAKTNIYKINKIRYKKAFEEYEKTLLNSTKEVNDTLYSSKIANKNLSIIENRHNLQKNNFALVEKKEIIGVINIIDKLAEKEKTILSEQQFVTAKINEIIEEINLYKSTGGVNIFQNNNSNL